MHAFSKVVKFMTNFVLLSNRSVQNKCVVKINKKRTDFFFQGCNLFLTLFNVYIDELAVLLEQSAAPGLNLNKEVKFLLYADDLVLLSPVEQGNLLKQYCQNWALTVNFKKSKILLNILNINSHTNSQCPQNEKSLWHCVNTEGLALILGWAVNPDEWATVEAYIVPHNDKCKKVRPYQTPLM